MKSLATEVFLSASEHCFIIIDYTCPLSGSELLETIHKNDKKKTIQEQAAGFEPKIFTLESRPTNTLGVR